ncbi:hypothetical protein EUGRSUZ_C02637 [Eucalyptus grandis]|uniref:Uncharacterized protein n=2 Tax=Eucalyptus grandis TaxID=71139 RepID=A0ACC3LH36_EUCGR|nr:hypothetical protein EUGRSUZ_C02637 [Eucalyptus grandis]
MHVHGRSLSHPICDNITRANNNWPHFLNSHRPKSDQIFSIVNVARRCIFSVIKPSTQIAPRSRHPTVQDSPCRSKGCYACCTESAK